MTVFEAARQIDCIRAGERLGLYMKRSGSKYFTRCLFHAENTPSMCLYPDHGGFYCFGCNEHGDVITLYAKALNLKPIDAAKQICSDFGLAYDRRKQKSSPMQRFIPRLDARTLGKRLDAFRESRVDRLLGMERTADETMLRIERRDATMGRTPESVLDDPEWQEALTQRTKAREEIEWLDNCTPAQLLEWVKEEINDGRKPA